MADEFDDILDEVEEDFSAIEEDTGVYLNPTSALNDQLNTHQRIKSELSGVLVAIDKNFAKVNLITTREMCLDDMGLIHSGFIFSAADFAAAASVNEENLVIIGAKTSFLAPAKVEDVIEFEAHSKFEDSRKREINVVGKVNDIKIFDGLFHAVILDKHIFKVKIKNAHRDY